MNILQELFKLLLLVFGVQAVIGLFYVRTCSYCDYVPDTALYVLGGGVFVGMYLLLAILTSNTPCPRYVAKKNDFALHALIWLVCLGICYYFYDTPYVYGLKSYVNSGHTGVGLIYKIGSSFLPAILLYLVINSEKGRLEYLSIAIITLTLLVIAFNFMTKSTLVGLLFIPWLLRSKVQKKILFLMGSIATVGWLMVGFIRESGRDSIENFDALLETKASVVSVFFDALYRLPNFYDYTLIIERWNPNLLVTPTNFMDIATEVIFDFRGGNTGIATSYLGALFILTGYLSFILAPMIVLTLRGILNKISQNAGMISCIFYYVIFFEFVPFFMDGNPSFLTGTNNYLLFWLIFGSLAFFLLIRKPNANYNLS